MKPSGKTPSSTNVPKNVAISWWKREVGVSTKKSTGPPKQMEWVAEEKMILGNHEEFPCSLPDGTRSTFLMVFSPDGTMIASTHGNHNVYVTDLRSGRVIKTLSGHPRTPWCIAFHPSSNQILASGCLGGQVRVWDLHGGSEIWNAESQTVIASLAFHPSDRVLVIASYNEIFFWDWSQERPFARCSTSNEREKVRYVSFDQLGHKLVTGIANVHPRQSQWDRVSAPQPSPQVSQLEHERRITICYRYMVEQYEQLVERYIQLSSQGPGGSTNYYLRRVAVPPQTMDRGTDPMDAPAPSTSSGSGTARCTVCSGDLVGRSCSRLNSASSSSSSSSTSSSSSSSSSSTSHTPSEEPVTTPEEPPRPRGTNEINASHSSSQFLPSPTWNCYGLLDLGTPRPAGTTRIPPRASLEHRCPSASSAGNSIPAAGTSAPAPTSSASELPSSSQQTPSSSTANGISDLLTLPLSRRPIGTLRTRSFLPHNCRSVSSTGISTPSLNSFLSAPPPEPHSSSQQLPDPSSSSSGTAPDLSSLPSFVRASYLYERLNRFRAQVETGRSILAQTRTISRMSPSAPEDVNYLIDDPLTESIPSRSSLNSDNRSGAHISPVTIAPVPPRSSPPLPVSSVTLDPSLPSDLNDGESSQQSLLSDVDASIERDIRNMLEGRGGLSDSGEVDDASTSDLPAPTPASGPTGRGPIEEADMTLVCPRGCLNPHTAARSNFGRWTPSCLRHFSLRQRASLADRYRLYASVTASPTVRNTSTESNTGPPPNLSPTSVRPPPPPSPPPQPSASSLLLADPTNDIESQQNEPAVADQPETFDGSSSNDSSSAIARLRAQFRRLQSVYNNNRDRESHLLRVAAENAERRLITRLSNLFGRPGVARGASPSFFEPGHDLRSIRYGLQLLRRNIYTMSRVYRYCVDRRRLDRIWRLWLDLQGQIFFLQRAVRDDESEDDQSNSGPPDQNERPPHSTLTDETPAHSLLNSALTPSYANRPFQFLQTQPSSSPGLSRSTVFVRVNPSRSSTLESSNTSRPPGTASSVESMPVLSTTTDDESSDSSFRRHRRSSVPGPPPPPRRVSRFRGGFSRSNQRNTKRARYDHQLRTERFSSWAFGDRPDQSSAGRLETENTEDDDDEGDDLDLRLMGTRGPIGLKRRLRLRNSTTSPGPSTSEQSRPSTSRFSFPTRLLRGRPQRNLRVSSRFNELRNLYSNQTSSEPQPGTSRDQSATSANTGPWSRESLRNRARHMLLLMLDSLTQFFENDSFARSTTAENSNERVSNLISLLELASNLTELLLTQLQNSRMRRERLELSRRRLFSNFGLNPMRISTRSEPLSSSSSGGIGVGGAASPGTSSSSDGGGRIRLPLLMVNDGPVPPEPDVAPPPFPPRSQPSRFVTYQFRPRVTQYLQAHLPTHPNRLAHHHNHPPHHHNHSVDDSADELPSPHDRFDVMYGRAFPNGSGPSVFMTEAPSAPHHRVQVWDFTKFTLPEIDCPDKNVVVPECKIHNDASVDISKDGSMVVTLLPSGRLSHVTTMLGVYSLAWGSVGQCLYTTSFEQNAVSVSLSPTNHHLVVGLASRRISFLHCERQTVAQIFRLEGGKPADKADSSPGKGKLSLIRDLVVREPVDFMSINCIRWFPMAGQGFIYGTNSGKLKVLR